MTKPKQDAGLATGQEGFQPIMPRPQFYPNTYRTTILSLSLAWERFQSDETAVRSLYPWADRFVMGLPLAPWQRQAVWSEEQKIRFITSVWSGLDLGTYLINEPRGIGTYSGKDRSLGARPLVDCVLDGQQRLSAIEAYISGQIAVPDALGVERYYADLPEYEKRHFTNQIFSRSTVSSTDEEVLRRIYDLCAFGGTPHEEHERASSPRPKG